MTGPMRSVELGDDVAALLESEQPLAWGERETIVMDLFRRGKISTGRACELLGLEWAALVRRAAELGIPYFLMSKEDLNAEKATIDAWNLP